MTRRILPVFLLALLLFPAAARADSDALTRGAFGHGTITASAAAGRTVPPACTTPASNPASVQANCPAFAAGNSGQCTIRSGGLGNFCQITLNAVASTGWAFDHWSAGPCATSTNALCTFQTTNTTCTGGAEPECDPRQLFGPWTAVAVFNDTRAPAVTIAGPGQNTVALDGQGQQTFSFTTNEDDEAPTFQCRLDIGATAACASPVTLSNLSNGEHELCVTPSDASGLAGAKECRHWDQERPASVQLTNTPAAATNSAAATFNYTSNQPSATFECKLDGGAFAACPAAGKALTGLSDGTHVFSARASFHAPLDPAGTTHTGAVSTFSWLVDTTPPETTITGGPDEGSAIVDVAPTFTFSASEAGSITCALDAAAPAPCASPFTTPTLLAGPHTLTVTAIDAVGNADPTPATRTFSLKTGLQTLVDADHDGFPQSLDCNDQRADVHPGALEIPGNATDENCDGVVAPFPRAAATLTANGSAGPHTTTFKSFVVSAITPGAKVELRCSGPKHACPFTKRTLKVSKGKASVKRFTAKVGAKLDVVVTAHGFIGKVLRVPVIKNRFARLQTLCLAPGASKPGAC